MLKKTISVILAIQILVSAMILTSCNNTEGPQGETTPAPIETDEAAPEGFVKLEGEPIELTSDCSLVIGDRNNDTVFNLATQLKSKISSKTGIILTWGYDGSENEKEIIVGYSDKRESSEAVYSTLGRSEFSVSVSGGSLLLSGWSKDTLTAAVDLFIEHSLVQEDGKWMMYPYAKKVENSEPMLADISLYRIVYPADASNFLKNTVIQNLQDNIKKNFGVMLDSVRDSEPAAEYEIVVGNTNRTPDTVRSQIAQTDLYSYILAAEGKTLCLFANSDLALYTAASEMCKYSVPEIGPEEFCLKDTPSIAGAPKTSDKAELAESADIRIMSYNILHPSWSNVVDNVPIAGRDVNLAKILLYYMPDVAGIQEVNSGWHTAIKKILVDTGCYKQACKMTKNGSKTNMTTFLYNPNTVKLIDEYVLDLQSGSDIRVFSVAVFEKLSDGKRFVVTNTHPAPASQNYEGNFAEIMKIAPREFEKYRDLPIIMTGDFNTSETHVNYKKLMDTLGFKDTKYDAETLVRRYNTFMKSGWGGKPQQGDNCIDHIFINDHAHAKLFNVIIDHNVEKISDHLPIYADIEFK